MNYKLFSMCAQKKRLLYSSNVPLI